MRLSNNGVLSSLSGLLFFRFGKENWMPLKLVRSEFFSVELFITINRFYIENVFFGFLYFADDPFSRNSY